MNNHAKVAEDLISSLELALPPIAVSFAGVAPANVPSYDGLVPAGCVFWQQAATRTFVTSAQDHALCSIGVHMNNLDYVRPEEVAAIPVIKREVKHVIYGPLADFPLDPEVVLLFAHARQGLILSEAIARVDQGSPLAMGRPACAVVPQALNHGNAAMSLGCCGARTYLDTMTDSVAMWALPASKLDRYCAAIAVLARANKTLATFHSRRREDVESGKRPTVRQSLERLSS